MRTRTLFAALAMAAVGTTACDDGFTAPPNDLPGLWNLAHQERPSIYGYTSAQVVFRTDGTFSMLGTNPLSQAPLGEWRVEGTWTRVGDRVTLDAGDEAREWRIRFEEYARVRFTDPVTDETFTLFRPGPD